MRQDLQRVSWLRSSSSSTGTGASAPQGVEGSDRGRVHVCVRLWSFDRERLQRVPSCHGYGGPVTSVQASTPNDQFGPSSVHIGGAEDIYHRYEETANAIMK